MTLEGKVNLLKTLEPALHVILSKFQIVQSYDFSICKSLSNKFIQ